MIYVHLKNRFESPTDYADLQRQVAFNEKSTEMIRRSLIKFSDIRVQFNIGYPFEVQFDLAHSITRRFGKRVIYTLQILTG